MNCELCEAARITPWVHEDDICWVADCEICAVPMVVWKRHGPEPPDAERAHRVAPPEPLGTELFGEGRFNPDAVMPKIPAPSPPPARAPGWWMPPFPRRT